MGINREPVSGVGPLFSNLYEDIKAIGGAVTGACRHSLSSSRNFFLLALLYLTKACRFRSIIGVDFYNFTTVFLK